ncbi:flagellar hook-basal body complex protein FliE [Salimicrobium album]|uniref:Flagellar hook-basal body complex protein FliE n=1 Tax=Salimicrobium album TaxID=50717 RepID=A0A1H3ANT7_9BACI|nr:flagellar hook-basal body complex protein FliE [Salimicrobium album]SDX31410.1 flagellar hook-basal body complex protein FliE [Salimicrobium album]
MVNPINGLPQIAVRDNPGPSASEVHSKFGDSLKNAIDGVNNAQGESNEMTKALARGEVDDLHNVMITSQKASIMMSTATEVQSKVIEAYKEVMRMQV